jgi:glycosyltransferase involved in cell wall biosynthesis
MKVVHVCTDASGGGAAQSMVNLHRALLQTGLDSTILADAPALGIEKFDRFTDDPQKRASRSCAADLLVSKNRSPISNSYFSIDLLGSDLSCHPLVQRADVINLHWTADFLSSRSIVELAKAGKKIVWTLHDMRPLTGGCHFPAGCRGFTSGCIECPQLIDNTFHITERNFLALREAVNISNPFFVAPSSWMAENVMKSGISNGLRYEVIHYGVDTMKFSPGKREDARMALSLPADVVFILVACQSFLEKRKGFTALLRILDHLHQIDQIKQRIETGSIRLLFCGKNADGFSLPCNWQSQYLGYLDNDGMVNAYRSANLLLFTSLEDNLPNVIMEAMSCGLPVAAHTVGGVLDLIGDKANAVGLHLDSEKPGESARNIAIYLQNSSLLNTIAERSRFRIQKYFSLEQQALKYLSVYSRTVNSSRIPLFYTGEGSSDAALFSLEKNFKERRSIPNYLKKKVKAEVSRFFKNKIRKNLKNLSKIKQSP